MSKKMMADLESSLSDLKKNGLFKEERQLASPQRPELILSDKSEVLNFCANNYLGLADSPELVSAAEKGLKKFGYGLASVRFICGTQVPHVELEKKITQFLKTEDTILYSSCFDANTGLFETLLGEEDAIISDELNHASIIDGIRLCKSKRFRYKNNDMEDLRKKLMECHDARYRLIATDGVFSMDGVVANLKGICDLAGEFDALVVVDDSHAVGFVGENGSGTPEHCGVQGRVDLITGTLGKALGGATGGYTSGRKNLIAWLRQRSRPYLFSNTLAPSLVSGSLAALDLVQSTGKELRTRLWKNTEYFRKHISKAGFRVVSGFHPIVPVMLGDAVVAVDMAKRLLKEGIYVIAFSFPVVPEGKARIRLQISAAHTREELDKALVAFKKVGKELGVIQ